MTYEQSLSNFNKLKSLLSPYNCEHIFFNYSDDKNFTVEFYEFSNIEFIQNMLQEKLINNLPYARILFLENGLEELYYIDKFVDISFNIFKDCYEDFVIYQKADANEIKKQVLILFNVLKKS